MPKVYEAGCKHPVTPDQVQRLLEGVLLLDDPVPVRAAAVSTTGPRDDGLQGLVLTLTDGRYHQVKRMVAAVGNRVERLHRSAFGALALPADLAPGQWRWLPDAAAIWPPA